MKSSADIISVKEFAGLLRKLTFLRYEKPFKLFSVHGTVSKREIHLVSSKQMCTMKIRQLEEDEKAYFS